MITEIREVGRRAAGLTRQLLAFSRKQILHPQPLIIDANSVTFSTSSPNPWRGHATEDVAERGGCCDISPIPANSARSL